MSLLQERTCMKCKASKPETDFTRNEMRYCKACINQYQRTRIANNPQLKAKNAERCRAYRLRNPEAYKQTQSKRSQRFYLENRTSTKQYQPRKDWEAFA